MEFEWDPKKAEKNLEKHGVSFHEASLAFFDDNAVELFDDLNSDEEIRYQLVGLSNTRRYSSPILTVMKRFELFRQEKRMPSK